MTTVSFGAFVLDLDTRELRRGSEFVPLTPKAYQLLEVLVANGPKALSKSALQERLWPDTFVLEKNLALRPPEGDAGGLVGGLEPVPSAGLEPVGVVIGQHPERDLPGPCRCRATAPNRRSLPSRVGRGARRAGRRRLRPRP